MKKYLRRSKESYADGSKKAAATKFAKRIEKACPRCGKTWMEKPSHAWRVFCSRGCAAAAKNTHVIKPCPDCGAPKTMRASEPATRCKACCAKLISKRQKARGFNPWTTANDESRARWLEALTSEEHAKKLSAIFKDKPKMSACHARFSPSHVKAVECFFRSPMNVVYYVRNICRFVNQHKGLFLEQDTLKKDYSGKYTYACNATHGLAAVARGYRGSWKGWMAVSNREGRERFDLIARNREVEK